MNDAIRNRALELDRAGFTLSEVARRLQIRQDEARALLRDAKHLMRYGTTPAESGRRKLGSWLRSPLDQLRNLGDSVTVSKTEGGSRSNVYALGINRGWRVSVVSAGESWCVTAVSRSAQKKITSQAAEPRAHMIAPEIAVPVQPTSSKRSGNLHADLTSIATEIEQIRSEMDSPPVTEQ